jgi:hypothetical protein
MPTELNAIPTNEDSRAFNFQALFGFIFRSYLCLLCKRSRRLSPVLLGEQEAGPEPTGQLFSVTELLQNATKWH